MTTKPKQSMRAHVFVPDPEAPDWRRHLTACRRCGMPRSNRLHTEPDLNGDRSDAILGERGDAT